MLEQFPIKCRQTKSRSLQSITKDTDNTVGSSTRVEKRVLKNVCEQVMIAFCFASDWKKVDASFVGSAKPITGERPVSDHQKFESQVVAYESLDHIGS